MEAMRVSLLLENSMVYRGDESVLKYYFDGLWPSLTFSSNLTKLNNWLSCWFRLKMNLTYKHTDVSSSQNLTTAINVSVKMHCIQFICSLHI